LLLSGETADCRVVPDADVVPAAVRLLLFDWPKMPSPLRFPIIEQAGNTAMAPIASADASLFAVIPVNSSLKLSAVPPGGGADRIQTHDSKGQSRRSVAQGNRY
jgi:hypothetical protein